MQLASSARRNPVLTSVLAAALFLAVTVFFATPHAGEREVSAVASAPGGGDTGPAPRTVAPATTSPAPTTTTTTPEPVAVPEAPLLVDGAPVQPRALGRRPRVAFFGDSLGVETTAHLRRLVRDDRDMTFSFDGFGGTATCDYLKQMRTVARRDDPDVVVLLFTGNALTPCITSRLDRTIAYGGDESQPSDIAGYAAAYRDDTIAAVDAFDADTQIVIVEVPVTRKGSTATTLALAEIYRDVAATRANVFELSVDRMLTPGHQYHDTLPCTLIEPCPPGEPVAVRAGDGTHLCPPKPAFCHGGFRMALMIADAVDLLVSR